MRMLPNWPNALDRSETMQRVQLTCGFNLVRGDVPRTSHAHHSNEQH